MKNAVYELPQQVPLIGAHLAIRLPPSFWRGKGQCAADCWSKPYALWGSCMYTSFSKRNAAAVLLGLVIAYVGLADVAFRIHLRSPIAGAGLPALAIAGGALWFSETPQRSSVGCACASNDKAH